MKVFVVDDSKLLRTRIVRAVRESAGVSSVEEADRVTGTAERIREANPDVLILDLRLGDGSGFQVLDELKDDDVRPYVIVFTNYPFPQYRAKCLEYGVGLFMDKSRSIQELTRYMLGLQVISTGSFTAQARGVN